MTATRAIGMTTTYPAELRVARTRLHRPRPPADVIDRPQLLARLDRAVDVKMTLVWAPAGYGKSTLLGSWLAASPLPTAWLPLDGSDMTVPGFVRALVAAIRAVVPEVGKSTLALLNLPEPPSPVLLATTLTDELGALSEPPVVVLDNYERVHTPSVHELLSSILLHLPPRLHVVVSSRTLP